MAASTSSMCFDKYKQTPSKNNLISVYRKCHVTALRFYEEYLFIGEGHTLELFYTVDLLCLQRLQIFKNCTIHGIVPDLSSQKYLVIYGAKSLVIAKFFINEKIRIELLSPIQHLEDWIWDILWLENTDHTEKYLAIALAHNYIILRDWRKEINLLRVECNDKCILYCGKLIGNHWNNLVFAAGTVFKEVVIWTPSDATDDRKVKPIHRLKGHEGVIFSITFNPKLQKLSTTSDDRVVRIWKFYIPNKNFNYINDFNLSIEEWKNGSFKLLYKFYGHEARVWTAALLPYCVLSVGEDSTLFFWNYDGKLLRKERCHSDGSIWSLDINSNCTLAATGGSDGGVILWDLKGFISDENAALLHLPQNDDKKDFPRNISLLSLNDKQVIFVATNEGALFSYSVQDKNWKLVFKDKEFYSYNILVSSPCGKLLLFGNITGKTYLFQFTDDNEIIEKTEYFLHNGKIHNMLWVTEDSNYLLSCGSLGEMILWKLKNLDQYRLEKQASFILPVCKQRWMSAAIFDSLGSLILGDRDGNIYTYNYSSKEPNQKFYHIHGKNGVTDIKEYKLQIFSSGRDGRIFVFKSSNYSLQKLYAIKITINLEWIGKINFYNNNLILIGFHTTNFIVWNLDLNRSLMEISCGGGHRSWDFSINENYNFTFACIRKNEIVYGRKNVFNIMNKSSLKKSLWGRELCCILFLFHLNDIADVFACGGEDNSLMIIKFIYDNSQKFPYLELMHRLHGHISNIRAIKSIQVKDNILRHILVSLGGRAQLFIWEITYTNGIVTCFEIANNKQDSENKLLKKPWITKTCASLPDPQTRYLDACIWEQTQKDIYMIAVACSDALLRIFKISLSSKELQLHQTISHGNYCILSTSVMFIQNFILILTGSTDGVLKIFSNNLNFKENTLSNKIKLEETNKNNDKNTSKIIHPKSVLEKQLHQCGINAICLYKISDTVWILFTGGDDNCLNASVIITNGHLIDIKTFTYPTVHYAQITGISVLSEDRLLTTSIDQRIHLWHWEFDAHSKTISLDFLSSVISCIPDIACLNVYKRKNQWLAAVCGQGLEVFVIH